MNQKSINKLVDRYLNGTASEAESKLVETFLDELNDGSLRQLSPDQALAKESLLLTRINSGMKGQKSLLVSMSRWWKAGIAAAVILVAASLWLLTSNKSKPQYQNQTVAIKDVKAPKIARAVITLADGSKVYLDSANSGQLAVQGNVRLEKLSDGQIAYQTANGETLKELRYNTLSNPRGSKVIDMKLSDGSHVWLNSGASITYPVAFIGDERRIRVDGEAYFEVAHDASKPFIVTKGETSVQVLGTHFNVNAYNDEGDIKVTLLQGSVVVSNKSNQVKINPGEQARVGSNIVVVKDIDLDEIMAWKNGMFALNGTDLSVLMRQISRWYDVDIVVQSSLPNTKFGGLISREVSLSDVLTALKEYGVNAEFINGKVIVR